MRTHKLGVGPRKYFTMTQLREVWDDAKRRQILYNGMTFALLREKYRRPVYHKMGVGFFYYPHAPELPLTEDLRAG